MVEREQLVQPDTVSEQVSRYLDITAPRARRPRWRPPRRADRERTTRPARNHPDLGLEEGNDFA